MGLGSPEALWGQTKVSAAEQKEHEDLLSAKRVLPLSSNQQKLIDYVSGTNPIYVGNAPKGLAEGTDGWLIQKITYDGNNNPTAIKIAYGNWTARAGYTYS